MTSTEIQCPSDPVNSTATDEVLVTETRTLALLAPNQWQFKPHFDGVLAAFVLSGAPCMHAILRREREILDDDDERALRQRERACQILER